MSDELVEPRCWIFIAWRYQDNNACVIVADESLVASQLPFDEMLAGTVEMLRVEWAGIEDYEVPGNCPIVAEWTQDSNGVLFERGLLKSKLAEQAIEKAFVRHGYVLRSMEDESALPPQIPFGWEEILADPNVQAAAENLPDKDRSQDTDDLSPGIDEA
jgi:hypothetical protein